jgi:hypothetical protein
MRTLLMTSLLALAISGSAIAAETQTTGAVELKDGTTLHIYKDGKMTMVDKVGKPKTMPEGTPMETKNGKIIMMKGNEVWRLYQSTDKTLVDDLMREGH